MVLAPCEMQTASSWIRIQGVVSISYDLNRYTVITSSIIVSNNNNNNNGFIAFYYHYHQHISHNLPLFLFVFV